MNFGDSLGVNRILLIVFPYCTISLAGYCTMSIETLPEQFLFPIDTLLSLIFVRFSSNFLCIFSDREASTDFNLMYIKQISEGGGGQSEKRTAQQYS